MPLHKFYIVFFSFIFLNSFFLKANDRFYISNIRVDVKDTSAAQARLKAIVQGQRKAFKMLIEQLLSPEDQASLTQPTENQLNAMIQDFEVQNEKNSNVRYIGTFAFQFYPVKVEEFLKLKDKTILAANTNEKILVLPIYEKDEKIFLWQEDNPWRNAWNQAINLKPHYILPLGDLNDILDFPERLALKKDLKGLQTLRERYHGGYILLAVLKQEIPFELSLFLYDDEGLSHSEEELALLGDSSLTPALIQKALNKTTDAIDKFLSESKHEATTETHSFEVRVLFGDHQEWSKIQKILSTTALVRSFDVLSLQRQQAMIRLYHKGSETRIFEVLKKQGFSIDVFSQEKASKVTKIRFNHLKNPSLLKNFEQSKEINFNDKSNQIDDHFYKTLESKF